MFSSSSSLCPGYKHVESFGPDEEYEDGDEEVTYITLDLGLVEPTLVPSSSTYRLIGLDTPTPFLQLSGTILKGQHETLLGTELLFTDGKDTQQQHDWNKRSVNHVATTEQRIRFREVQLKPKGEVGQTKSESKGKGKVKAIVESATAEELVNRVAGIYPTRQEGQPKTRAKRQTRGKAKTTRKGKGKADDVQPLIDLEAAGSLIVMEPEGEGEAHLEEQRHATVVDTDVPMEEQPPSDRMLVDETPATTRQNNVTSEETLG